MKIKKIELFKVPPRWLFLKITTASGITGWGEPVIEGKADTVKAAVEEMASYLTGKDARHIEDIWQTLYRGGFYRGGPILMSAIAGIDQALWDIKGKALGVPVYELLGGAVRDKMKIYGWIGGDKPSQVVAGARKRMEDGFLAVKMNACSEMEWIDTPKKIEEAVTAIASVRDAIGYDRGLGIDFHGRVHKGMAKAFMRELDLLKPMFIEEPVLSENFEAFSGLAQYTAAPIATGERLFSRWDFKRLFEQGAVDIIQPDVSHAGGITEVKKIAAMAEAYDVALAPHCPLGPVSFAAALHIDFSCINAFIQESSIGIHYNEGTDLLDYLLNPEVFDIKNGYISRPVLPGLGVEINEEKVREMAKTGHSWKNPVWRNPDGSITEW
ncbi:galactonate dehydratase [Agriterribacter sp.]|uniref:galactonate dehydratase n=1 Tax=Agriterribacter sp. TaxID=2821509 RepID=UPI002C92FC67|nr:galactonate dehydratase [Agriterribacter sp.]HRO44800.1 galactonate dehydratase [Agriterribacter sp.]HRQ18115.1 galactonate dehydratase [Agriterribacter sp.]